MGDLVKMITSFVDAVALIMALVLIVSLLHRADRLGWVNNILMGAMFSLAVMFTMSDPMSLPSGGVYDMRTLLIGTSVALLGPVVGFMAFVTGMVCRWCIGGDSAMVGMVGIVLTYGAGLIWWYAVRELPWAIWKKSVLLGIMISVNSFAILLTPQQFWMPLLISLVPYIFASNILGSLLLHKLIRGELSFQSNAKSFRKDASTDHLTGLLNRRGFDLAYPAMDSQKNNERGWGLLCFDLDRFKQINDTYGHAVGDAVLQFVAEKVSGNLRPRDVFARLGGDEFAVVLSEIDAQEAELIAQRCRAVVADGGFQHHGETLPISMSVGGIWMLDQIEMDRFMDEADQALYAAKTSGRNKVVFKSGVGDASLADMGIPA